MDAHSPALQETPFCIGAMSDMTVRQTAAMHELLLPNGLFPALGQRFIRQWHRSFTVSPHAIGLIANAPDGTCCGFLIGTLDQRQYTSGVLRHQGPRLACSAAPALLLRPRLGIYFARTRGALYLRKLAVERGRSQRPHPRSPADGVAVLHAIVTSPTARGRGLGLALLRRFEQELMANGVPTLQLVTHEQGGAVDFYRKAGYVETDRRRNRDGDVIVQFDRYFGEAQ